MATFLKYDMFQKGDYQKYLPDRITPEMVERDTFVRIFSSTIGMSYNKARAPSIPERVSDLLKPEWKGKVATTPFGAGFELLAAKEAWGADKTIDFAKQFTNQLAGFMLCNEADRLASGEFLAFAFDCGGGRMLLAAQKGAPIVRVLVPEVPIVSYFYLAVPKNSQHPNAARLFTTYIMTKQGQKDSWDMNLTDLHLLPESIVAKDIREAEQKYNFKYKEADIAWQEVSNDGGNAALTQVQTILKEKP
jgi:iron(III) transport system substrate-binding protein